ncbi:GNAT family N-acetyltransferase [Microbacterium sp. NPDC089318]
MATITTGAATIRRWDDVQHALSGGGDGRSCQCIWPVVRNRVWQTTSLDERRDMLHDEIDAGPPPGLIAYVDGEAAGWIRVGPRTVQQRILHTRAITAATAEPLDDESVWAVTCFVVRKEHRGQGLNATLLASGLDFARESGARLIEAYPVDTSTGSHRSNDLFHGTLSTFLAAGFERGPTLTGGRVLVTRGLAD